MVSGQAIVGGDQDRAEFHHQRQGPRAEDFLGGSGLIASAVNPENTGHRVRMPLQRPQDQQTDLMVAHRKTVLFGDKQMLFHGHSEEETPLQLMAHGRNDPAEQQKDACRRKAAEGIQAP